MATRNSTGSIKAVRSAPALTDEPTTDVAVARFNCSVMAAGSNRDRLDDAHIHLTSARAIIACLEMSQNALAGNPRLIAGALVGAGYLLDLGIDLTATMKLPRGDA